METKPKLGKRMKAWFKYQDIRENGTEEQAQKALEEYLDCSEVQVQIGNTVEGLEAQLHEQILGVRSKRKVRLTGAAVIELQETLKHIAEELLLEAGLTAYTRDITGEGEVIVDAEHIHLAYLDLLAYTEEEYVEEYNRAKEILQGA